MVERISGAYQGRTIMSIIPDSGTKEISEDFRKVLDSVASGTKTTEGMDLEGIFQNASRIYGVPVYLLKAVAKAESNFDANDVSSSGAMGIMQLMPETARELGVENAFDPEENIMGGARYLSEKLAQYKGNVELALAAYNAGSGNVEKYGGIPPFEETVNYVERVTAYMEEYKQEQGAAASGSTQAASAQAEGLERGTSLGKDALPAMEWSGEAMAAYERMRDGTYWKVLQ